MYNELIKKICEAGTPFKPHSAEDQIKAKPFTVDGMMPNTDYQWEGDKLWLRHKGEKLEVRNECWDCGKLWDMSQPEPYEEGQKHYYKCNHCGMVNHL